LEQLSTCCRKKKAINNKIEIVDTLIIQQNQPSDGCTECIKYDCAGKEKLYRRSIQQNAIIE
jgi:hypothetical protein